MLALESNCFDFTRACAYILLFASIVQMECGFQEIILHIQHSVTILSTYKTEQKHISGFSCIAMSMTCFHFLTTRRHQYIY